MQTSKNQSFFARLGFAWAGVVHAVRSEHSLRLQVLALGIVLVTLAWFRPEPEWWAITLLASAAVLAAELFNTAIEHLADHLHPEVHPAIRVVKDCGAAAVLMTSLAAVAVAVALAVHLARRVS